MPLIPLLTGLALLALSVVIHATVISLLLRRLRHHDVTKPLRFGQSTWVLVQVAWWVVLAHMLEIALWAAAYRWVGAFPDLNTAVYFSGVTYATVGYGDVLIPDAWHNTAVLEGLTGILMAGWSTAFLFAVLNQLLRHGSSRHGPPPDSPA